MFAGPTKDAMAVFPTRAVALPKELFEAQHASLRREFANIERLLGR